MMALSNRHGWLVLTTGNKSEMSVGCASPQITGAIARRIVAWANVGDELRKGERFGMIRFGSRTELYLPLSATILVKVGDHVAGGATAIARLPNE